MHPSLQAHGKKRQHMRDEFLPYCRPALDDDDIAAVVDSMQHDWLTTGPKVKEFEQAFSAACGVKHAVALNSCTAALHLGLVAMGVGKDDEVVMPALTFVAGAQCARHLGAKPVFADIDESTLCITPATVERVITARTKVIIPMHYGGHPSEIKALVDLAHANGIKVLEDAAHAAGTLDQQGLWPGAVSDAAAYSFYATKNLTSAEGGMFVTNDDALADRIRVLGLHGMDRDAWKRYTLGGKWKYDVVAPGYKYNMPDLAAALGIAQLKKLDRLQRRRDELAHLYLSELEGIPGIRPASRACAAPMRHSWCVFAILVDEEVAGISRDDLIDRLTDANIGTSVHFIPTHTFTDFHEFADTDLPVTDRVWVRMVSLPLFPDMTDADVLDVTAALKAIVGTGAARQRQATIAR